MDAGIVENYKRKYKRETPFEEVRFNIKNALLFKNGEIDFNDSVYHQIDIPYEWVDGERPVRGILTPRIECDMSLRVLLVNGMLKLQLGQFDKSYSPTILREGSLAVYDTWTTIATFPFLYFSHRHGLPVRYLNLSSHATSSYKATLAERGRPKKQKRFWQRSPAMFEDWSRLHQELAAYRILCDQDSTDYKWSTLEKLTKAFEEKRDAMLTSEGFDIPKKDADDWEYPDTGETCSNNYLWVSFQNFNLLRDTAERYWLVDFYEELP